MARQELLALVLGPAPLALGRIPPPAHRLPLHFLSLALLCTAGDNPLGSLTTHSALQLHAAFPDLSIGLVTQLAALRPAAEVTLAVTSPALTLLPTASLQKTLEVKVARVQPEEGPVEVQVLVSAGRLLVSFLAPRAGLYRVRVRLGGRHLAGSPLLVPVLAGGVPAGALARLGLRLGSGSEHDSDIEDCQNNNGKNSMQDTAVVTDKEVVKAKRGSVEKPVERSDTPPAKELELTVPSSQVVLLKAQLDKDLAREVEQNSGGIDREAIEKLKLQLAGDIAATEEASKPAAAKKVTAEEAPVVEAPVVVAPVVRSSKPRSVQPAPPSAVSDTK